MSVEKMGSGADNAPLAQDSAPRAPEKKYRIERSVSGMIGGKSRRYNRGDMIPARLAETIPNLSGLIGSGAIMVVYE